MRKLLVLACAVALALMAGGLGFLSQASAQSDDYSYGMMGDYGYGMMGPGMMGRSMMYGYGPGYGMMGGYYGSGPYGMMRGYYGYAPGYGHRHHWGPGYGRYGHGYGYGMMGPGW